jgi:hypothetical protein
MRISVFKEHGKKSFFYFNNAIFPLLNPTDLVLDLLFNPLVKVVQLCGLSLAVQISEQKEKHHQSINFPAFFFSELYPTVITIFLGPKWHSPIGSLPFHRAQKTLEFQGPTSSHCPRNGYARIQNIMHGAV